MLVSGREQDVPKYELRLVSWIEGREKRLRWRRYRAGGGVVVA